MARMLLFWIVRQVLKIGERDEGERAARSELVRRVLELWK